jgi:2-iminobutanoate/2-iminopropanoate deaminase
MPRVTIDLGAAAHKNPLPMAAKVGPLLVTSAVSGRDPDTGEVPQDPGDEVATLFRNLEAILERGGGTLDHVAKLTFYVRDLGLRDHINREWLARFPNADDRPARHTQRYDDMPAAYSVQAEMVAYID